jgi:polyphosphate kinase 2 (PPK2 family)
MSKWPKLDKMEFAAPIRDDTAYETSLEKLQQRLLRIQLAHLRTGGRVMIGVEGWDAAGKGGFIQRLIYGLEPRSVFVWRIGAPSQEELARHYLWRFWQRVPARKSWSVFDRSWYGRVLVERIEGFAQKDEWKRAYREINEFERQLADDGVKVIKILLHISEEEQKKRMLARLADPDKHYKIGLEDFRNISKHKEYIDAYDEMLERTDTKEAPWHVVASDDKKRARLDALELVADRLGEGLDEKIPPLDPKVADAAFRIWGWKADGQKR